MNSPTHMVCRSLPCNCQLDRNDQAPVKPQCAPWTPSTRHRFQSLREHSYKAIDDTSVNPLETNTPLACKFIIHLMTIANESQRIFQTPEVSVTSRVRWSILGCAQDILRDGTMYLPHLPQPLEKLFIRFSPQ